MGLQEEIPSSPINTSSEGENSLSYYKSQYEQLEAELADFQASSRELEAELERDIEASEKRERQLQEKVESLGYETEEWKVRDILHAEYILFCAILAEVVGQKANVITLRPSTSSPNLKRTSHKMPSRKRLLPFAIQIERSHSSSATLKWSVMTSRDRPGTLHHRSRI